MANPTSIESVQQAAQLFPPPPWGEQAFIRSREAYQRLYDRSINEPDQFWSEIAKEFFWFEPWQVTRQYDFRDRIDIKYFLGGRTNITVNALDRHVHGGIGHHVAYYWEGNDGEMRTVTYRELLTEVCKFANVLKAQGVKKGDRVTLYMPMIPELAVAVLACARIGAVHSVVFGGFSAESLKDRLLDAQSTCLITADAVRRGTKEIPLKETADAAMAGTADAGQPVTRCIVFRRLGSTVTMQAGRDQWWHDLMRDAAPECKPAVLDAEDPLFILYTSGSTGKPKGVLHTTGGYMVYTATTFKYVFDYHPGDIFWCTADIGWVTGHSYVVYGPLCNGATSVMFEGAPNHPAPDRCWQLCEKYDVTIFYTAPTAIRALMREGDAWPQRHDLSKLRVLGTVGEPINPEAWRWYHEQIGGKRCPIVDTWWQTETGGILITPLPGAFPLKPGSATLPFFGVRPQVVREDGTECGVNEGGLLVLTEPWPGIMRTVFGQHERFKETYFSRFPGMYFTGDGARRDEDGYFWLMGRVDDVINVSGHRIGTAEVESALVAHGSVAEAAVVGFPHEIKGQGLYAYVTLKADRAVSDALRTELAAHVRLQIGAIAVPDRIQFADALPKTRSGKIMRRILRKIAEGVVEDLGDTTTLAEPSVVQTLVAGRQA
ncbi:MAG: acetate--CoA ligase [Deltaproteobacteria bacterium]|nr:acetate--CoA ligase [Deltaproteobacteria bacterium]